MKSFVIINTHSWYVFLLVLLLFVLHYFFYYFNFHYIFTRPWPFSDLDISITLTFQWPCPFNDPCVKDKCTWAINMPWIHVSLSLLTNLHTPASSPMWPCRMTLFFQSTLLNYYSTRIQVWDTNHLPIKIFLESRWPHRTCAVSILITEAVTLTSN
jgi:hypothetical protein